MVKTKVTKRLKPKRGLQPNFISRKKVLADSNKRKYGFVFNRTRKPSGNRLNNGLVMPLLPLGIMLLVNITTSNPRKETLLLGESSQKPSNVGLTQQMISNVKRLPTIY